MNQPAERRSATRQSYRLTGPLRCAQCGDVSADARGWRGGRTDEPASGDPPTIAFWCAECWQAEFTEP
jgi:hypothetical protein